MPAIVLPRTMSTIRRGKEPPRLQTLRSAKKFAKRCEISPPEILAVKNSFEAFVWPLLRIAQVLGLYPICIDKHEEAKISKHSVVFRYSVFLLVFRLGGIHWSRSNAFVPLIKKFISSPTEEIFYNATTYNNAIYQFAHVLNTFWSLKVLLHIHKIYREFSNSFNLCFSKPFYFQVSGKRNLAVAFSAIPALSLITQYFLRPSVNESASDFWNTWAIKILEVYFGIQLIGSLIIEDCKLTINCLCITDGFKTFNQEVRNCLENPLLVLSEKSISEWKHLSLLLQRLSELTGSMTMLTQLTSIAQEIFLVTGLLFFNTAGLINGTKSIGSYGTILPCVMIVWHSLRQYVKFNLANSVTEESTALINHLRMADRSKLDLRTKEAFYDFTTHLMRNPASINFGKYFTLNKSSLFSVAGRVITYLIVVIQFQATSK